MLALSRFNCFLYTAKYRALNIWHRSVSLFITLSEKVNFWGWRPSSEAIQTKIYETMQKSRIEVHVIITEIAVRKKNGLFDCSQLLKLSFIIFTVNLRSAWTLNKAELVEVVSKETDATKKDVELVINKMMETIIKHVSGGDKVTLVGFGTFEARQRKARTGRNPKTNQPLHIPAKRVPGFKVGKEFGDAVNKKR